MQDRWGLARNPGYFAIIYFGLNKRRKALASIRQNRVGDNADRDQVSLSREKPLRAAGYFRGALLTSDRFVP